MKENLTKIFLLWSVQVFLIIMFLGVLINKTLPTHIKIVMFLGLLGLFESISIQKFSMSLQGSIYTNEYKDTKQEKKRGDIILFGSVK